MEYTISEKIARFVLEKDLDDIPENACNHAKMGILDWLGVVMVALKVEEKSINRFNKLILGLGGHPRATVIGTKKKQPYCRYGK